MTAHDSASGVMNVKQTVDQRPNIVLILADDMGYSDLGCYGAEIATPNLDALASGGVRFSQMYNCARCCPSRASLLTGLYPHQAGVGLMVGNCGVGPAYQGYLRQDCVTIAEVLRQARYRTYMSGKWHVGGGYSASRPETWRPGEADHPLPVQRGFDEHYGMLGGGGSYFHPPYIARNQRILATPGEGYYLTDAISQEAGKMIDDAAARKQAFFLYMAYTAPHWPLHAHEQDIARYQGRYVKEGWEGVRAARHESLRDMGMLDRRWPISPRDEKAPAWSQVQQRDWEDRRMAVYAAQVDRMDQGIGRVVAKLKEAGVYENTLIVFVSDNGGCAEFLAEDSSKPLARAYGMPTPDGRAMRMGNTPGIWPGADDTFCSYDLPWANASNTPFRLYKHWVHEGGIGTPMVVHWPGGGLQRGVVHEPCHVIDFMATFVEMAGAKYPAEYRGQAIQEMAGRSLLGLLRGQRWSRGTPLFWEHEGNCAVRDGQWKLVCRHPGAWELYDMEADRTELNDLAENEPQRMRAMVGQYEQWARGCGVLGWPLARV